MTMHVVATAGHVDHGKSALLERLTGMQPDRFDEERRRGLTIDLGYVWTELPTPGGGSCTVAFVDVPGHDQFIPNMLSGVGVVQRVLLVVAADDGWSAQSQEHLDIIELLGLEVALAVVSKAEVAGERRTGEVVAQVTARLEAAGLDGVPVVAADSVGGAGIDEVRARLAARLTEGATADDDRDPRLWVDRAFTVTGAGTVVTGMLSSGTLHVGGHVAVLPGTGRARIRGLQCLGAPVDSATAGSRVAVNLAGVSQQDIGRGAVVVGGARDGAQGLTSTRMDVELHALPSATIGPRGAWHLHLGTASTTVRVHPVLGEIEPAGVGMAQLELAVGLPARHGDRIVLRDAGRRTTAGGGRVLDPDPPPRPRGIEGRLAHALVLEDLADATDLPHRITGLVDACGGVRSRHGLRAVLGVPPGDVDGLDDLDAHLVRSELLAAWIDAAAELAAAADGEHPVATARLLAAMVEAGCPAHLADAVLARAVARERLLSIGGRHLHPDHHERYLGARARRRAALCAHLEADAHNPPDPAAAADEVGIPSYEVQALVEEGELIACGPLLFTAGAVREAVELLRRGPGRDGAAFTAGDARTAWDCTRRAAVPLLEHLAATRVTDFDGSSHRLRDPADGDPADGGPGPRGDQLAR